mmetsp:Transcript_8265/g.24454  ORF Transcript_8265/g.24454 Transcript_8265/m.24454 type:complete len:134 (+) Transcript_8265:994-1395(+)
MHFPLFPSISFKFSILNKLGCRLEKQSILLKCHLRGLHEFLWLSKAHFATMITPFIPEGAAPARPFLGNIAVDVIGCQVNDAYIFLTISTLSSLLSRLLARITGGRVVRPIFLGVFTVRVIVVVEYFNDARLV